MSQYRAAPTARVKCPVCGATRAAGGNTSPDKPCSTCKRMHKARVPNAPCLVTIARVERWCMHDRLTRLH